MTHGDADQCDADQCADQCVEGKVRDSQARVESPGKSVVSTDEGSRDANMEEPLGDSETSQATEDDKVSKESKRRNKSPGKGAQM